jgi:hypothetical protein
MGQNTRTTVTVWKKKRIVYKNIDIKRIIMYFQVLRRNNKDLYFNSIEMKMENRDRE